LDHRNCNYKLFQPHPSPALSLFWSKIKGKASHPIHSVQIKIVAYRFRSSLEQMNGKHRNRKKYRNFIRLQVQNIRMENIGNLYAGCLDGHRKFRGIGIIGLV
jgi:hypothetical protein